MYWLPSLISRTFNTVTFGLTSETFCARVYKRNWKVLRFCLDTLFFPFETEHCRRSYERCKERKLQSRGILMLNRYDIIALKQFLTKNDKHLAEQPQQIEISDGLTAYEIHYLNFLREKMMVTNEKN